MKNITFEPIKPEHSTIAAHLRQSDIDEINLLNSLSPELAIAFSIAASEKGCSVFLDGILCALFGISNGIIWLVGTDEISNHPITFFRMSKNIFSEISKGYSYLHNWVDARNSLSLRWLSWLGYSLTPHFIGENLIFHAEWTDKSCVP